jgi:hypothetical protein
MGSGNIWAAKMEEKEEEEDVLPFFAKGLKYNSYTYTYNICQWA